MKSEILLVLISIRIYSDTVLIVVFLSDKDNIVRKTKEASDNIMVYGERRQRK